MKIVTLKVNDKIQDNATGEIFTIATLTSGNPSYPIRFKEKAHSNWSFNYLQDNFTMVLSKDTYEIY